MTAPGLSINKAALHKGKGTTNCYQSNWVQSNACSQKIFKKENNVRSTAVSTIRTITTIPKETTWASRLKRARDWTMAVTRHDMATMNTKTTKMAFLQYNWYSSPSPWNRIWSSECGKQKTQKLGKFQPLRPFLGPQPFGPPKMSLVPRPWSSRLWFQWLGFQLWTGETHLEDQAGRSRHAGRTQTRNSPLYRLLVCFNEKKKFTLLTEVWIPS